MAEAEEGCGAAGVGEGLDAVVEMDEAGLLHGENREAGIDEPLGAELLARLPILREERSAVLVEVQDTVRFRGVEPGQDGGACVDVRLLVALDELIGDAVKAQMVELAVGAGAGDELRRLGASLDFQQVLDASQEAIAAAVRVVPGEAGGEALPLAQHLADGFGERALGQRDGQDLHRLSAGRAR